MTAINLDDQVVSTAFDPATRICSYTYQHSDGSRYTVKIPLDHLEKHGNAPLNKDLRRKHLAQCILTHVHTNPPDAVKENG